MKGPIFFALLFLSTINLQAQKYTTAAGVRLGGGVGLTLQQKLWGNTTFEGILQQRPNQETVVFTALLERHQKLIGKGLNFYLGAGPHIGWNTNLENGQTNPAGLTGVAGLEFTIGRLNLSWDYKPSVNLTGGNQSFNSQSGISLRYVFIKAKKKKKKWQFWKKDKNDKKGKKKR